jgi:hypothetical protein
MANVLLVPNLLPSHKSYAPILPVCGHMIAHVRCSTKHTTYHRVFHTLIYSLPAVGANYTVQLGPLWDTMAAVDTQGNDAAAEQVPSQTKFTQNLLLSCLYGLNHGRCAFKHNSTRVT